MLFYLAALQSVPMDVYEAAAIDKAGTWRTFWKITFPLLKPAHFFVAVVSVIGALKFFDQAFIISSGSGGPAGSTMTAVMYVYTVTIKEFNYGYGATVGVVLFLIIFSNHARPATPLRALGDRLLMSGREEVAPPVAAVRELALEGEAAVGTPVAIPPRTVGERARRAVLYVVMIAVALLYLVPFVYTVSTSLKTQAEAAAGFDLWPDQASLAAYREIWSREDLSFVTFFRNSLILASSITVITLFLATLGGYAFARLRFPFREPLFLLVLGTLMIPDQLRLVPVYLMMIDFPITGWNLTQTLHGYVFFGSSIALATSLFLMRQYFLTIPKDYEEAAKLDGAGYFKTYWRIMLPLAAPAVAAVAILTFQGIWNEFFWANLLLTGDSSNYTVQMGLVQFRFQYQTLWPQLMAATTIAIIPVLVVFILFQRYFVAGVTAAGVKG